MKSMNNIPKGHVPKGAKSRYILQNKNFPKGSFVLWKMDADGWEYTVYDSLEEALHYGQLLAHKNWTIMQVADYSKAKK